MSLPTEFDFALIKLGDGATEEAFAAVCGMQDATINTTVQTQDRFVRDCAKPGEIPSRKVKVTGRQLDITGSGLTDKASIATLQAALGKVKNLKIEGYADNGTDNGLLLGTFALAGVLTASNLTIARSGDATSEMTISSHGDWTWTAAS